MKEKSIIAIELEIKNKLTNLNELLKDNKEFAAVLLNNLLLIGKGVIREDLQELIVCEYSELNELGEFRKNLSQTIHDLSKLIYGSHPLVTKELIKHPQEEWEIYEPILRNEIEGIVSNTFVDIFQIDITGNNSDI